MTFLLKLPQSLPLLMGWNSWQSAFDKTETCKSIYLVSKTGSCFLWAWQLSRLPMTALYYSRPIVCKSLFYLYLFYAPLPQSSILRSLETNFFLNLFVIYKALLHPVSHLFHFTEILYLGGVIILILPIIITQRGPLPCLGIENCLFTVETQVFWLKLQCVCISICCDSCCSRNFWLFLLAAFWTLEDQPLYLKEFLKDFKQH